MNLARSSLAIVAATPWTETSPARTGRTVTLITRMVLGVRIVSTRGGGECDNWAPVTCYGIQLATGDSGLQQISRVNITSVLDGLPAAALGQAAPLVYAQVAAVALVPLPHTAALPRHQHRH